MSAYSIEALLAEAEERCAAGFAIVEDIERRNTGRVLSAFQHHKVAARHFAGTTGYGYGDTGRDTLEHVFAEAFGAEDALVRPQIMSGTHALALCFFGLLRPGDRLLCASGAPYDTLHQVIGIVGDDPGSLRGMGVAYDQVPLRPDNTLDIPAAVAALRPDTRVVHIQRSRGYAWRAALALEDIGRLATAVHRARPDVWVTVDNCYGEFVNFEEPTALEADMIVGSLIKNPGGGIAPTGGYVAGREELIRRVAHRLTSPGIGREVGSYAPGYQAYFQGLFFAPHVVAQALKTAMLAASAFDLLGFPVSPAFDAPRSDIIQAIEMGSPERLIAFCRGIQAASPVDSFAVPEPADMPGYQHPVIMAAGTFVSGASIELSADAPLRPPFTAYLQGGLTLAHGRLGLTGALRTLQKAGLLYQGVFKK